MKKKRWLHFMVLITLLVFGGTITCFGKTQYVFAADSQSNMETPAGIEFEKKTDTSSSKTEPSIPKDTTIKKGGSLPMTGELIQPLLFLIIGCLLFIFIVSAYFSGKGNKKGEI